MKINIRQAVATDVNSIADLHTRVWHATYVDIAPQSALDKLNLDHRTNDWLATFGAAGSERQTFVAIDRDCIVGFVHLYVDKPFGLGVVQYLYIEQDQKRRGIGRALMHVAFAKLADANCNAAQLAVADGNDAALAFYQSLGGKVQQKPVIQGHIWRSTNWIIRWDALKLEGPQ